MNSGSQPRFLTREAVDAIHEDQTERFGGLPGVRDENALESAIAAAQNVYRYGNGDVYELDASRLTERQTYDLMMKIADHKAGRRDLADHLRSELGGDEGPEGQP